ncbi:glycosyltransferase [Flavobacteriaceae bacterium Ap0902]|nr:glycosyltransferase [Flavobacteriaceae bacterium Ap0902]
MSSTNKIRVLHTHQIIRSGGVEQRKLILFNKLPKENFDQKIICTEAIGPKLIEFKKQGYDIVEVGQMKHPFDWNIHKKVIDTIKDFKPDIIHGTVYEGISMAAIGGTICRVPKIILEETSYPVTRSWRATKLLSLLSRTADKVIGVSPAVTDYLINTAKIKKEKVSLIMNGATIPEINQDKIIKNDLRHKFSIPNETIVLGSVGRMDNHIKGFSNLIVTMRKLIDQGLNVYLILVGDGILINEYKKLAKSLNIESKVLFTGYQHNVNPFYELFDIFILASSSESFGLVITEAWFHKLPVIASNVGGIPYLIDDGINGVLFELNNLEELTDKLKILIEKPELREKLGVKGHEEATTKYTADIYAAAIEKLYLELLLG